jgi:hypothetical protein
MLFLMCSKMLILFACFQPVAFGLGVSAATVLLAMLWLGAFLAVFRCGLSRGRRMGFAMGVTSAQASRNNFLASSATSSTTRAGLRSAMTSHPGENLNYVSGEEAGDQPGVGIVLPYGTWSVRRNGPRLNLVGSPLSLSEGNLGEGRPLLLQTDSCLPHLMDSGSLGAQRGSSLDSHSSELAAIYDQVANNISSVSYLLCSQCSFHTATS